MATEKKTNVCVECGSKSVWKTKSTPVEYQGETRRVRVAAWWCTNCGEAVLDGPALQTMAMARAKLKAEVDHVLDPAEVATIRKKLHLSQRKAGEVLGGGPRAFQKYEKGQQSVSTPMAHLLRLLANDPKRLKELATD